MRSGPGWEQGLNLHVKEIFSKGTPTLAFTRFPLCSYHSGNNHHIFCKGCQHFPLHVPLFLSRFCPHSPPVTPSGHIPLLPPQDGNQKEAGPWHLRPAPERLWALVGLCLVSPASQPPPPPAAASWHQTHCSSLSHPTGTLSQ